MRPDLALVLAGLIAGAGCTALRAEPVDGGRGERDGGPARDAGPIPDAARDAGRPRDAGERGDAGPCTVAGDETCDGTDEDCDGIVDETFQVTPAEVTFAVLATFERGCTSTAPDVFSCMTAARRWCLARGCAASGLGALREAADTRVACFGPRATELTVAYDDLSREGIVFDDTSAKNRRGQVAVHRYCRARGFGVGIGPTSANDGTRTATLVCVVPDWSGVVVLPVAASSSAGCDPFTNPETVRCNAVANDHCATLGWEAGIGPVEWDTSGVHIACLGDR